jgi:hypothetical protein
MLIRLTDADNDALRLTSSLPYAQRIYLIGDMFWRWLGESVKPKY